MRLFLAPSCVFSNWLGCELENRGGRLTSPAEELKSCLSRANVAVGVLAAGTPRSELVSKGMRIMAQMMPNASSPTFHVT